ncbi:beta-xylosidase [Opitutaceae bacterium TAV1]|nr:beta-xylosidase [Opitutaceae bacterium TAV1]
MSNPPLTWCNPLPLPDYPRGRNTHEKRTNNYGWLHPVRRDFREMADPTVLHHDGRWYLFPSCAMLWHSDDLVHWTHHPIEPADIGYAPTVVRHRNHFLMTAGGNQLWTAPRPLGPWTLAATIRDENNAPFNWHDPMLFSDDDGALLCYHGCGPDGIYVARMRDDDPARFAAPRTRCFGFDPAHKWERFGEHNQDATRSFIEGAWMNKIAGVYYLHYSAPGTEWKNYALGCYKSPSPLGPWTYQKRNPILLHRGGMINGCGHGCIVTGPANTLWCFYTLSVRIEHNFERRIGMDPAGIDANGDLFVAGPTETPQWAPGHHPDGANAYPADPARADANDAGLDILNANVPVTASSFAPGHESVYACDENIRTWWQAAEGAPAPHWLAFDLGGDYAVHSARVLFGDRGLDYEAGIVPGPYRYRIEVSGDGDAWRVAVDRSGNTVDRHIAYDVCQMSVAARRVRLVILDTPPGIIPSVQEFTVFGKQLLSS